MRPTAPRTPRSTLLLTIAAIAATILAIAFNTSIVRQAATTALHTLKSPVTKRAIMTTTTTTKTRAPVVALSHGGGPLPLLGESSHADITSSLTQRVPHILRLNTPQAPRAIALVTAHWVTDVPHVSAGAKPALLYDYYGFPAEAYDVQHNAPGAPDVAAEAAEAMRAEGLAPVLDDSRGWDHGVFVPMKLIDPSARTPLVQISVLSSESPAQHLALGRALGRLRASNVAIVTSGFASLHNQRIMLAPASQLPALAAKQAAFSAALGAAIGQRDVDARGAALQGWRNFPDAYLMHPRGGAEHFLPLVVAAGAAGAGAANAYKDAFRGFEIWSYYWDEGVAS